MTNGGDSHSATDIQIGDTQGPFGRFMATDGLRAMPIRPDFHLFGGAADCSRLTAFVEDFEPQMRRYGLNTVRTAAIA